MKTMFDSYYKYTVPDASRVKIFLAVWVMALVLTGCASEPPVTSNDRFDNIGAAENSSRAVTTLLAKVQRQELMSNWERAAALLERALRIEPRNARLWHRLARIRLEQGRYGMAESLAEKSNALINDDKELKRRNAELIETARR